MLAAAVAKPRGHSSQPNSKSRWEAVKVWPTCGGHPTLTPSVKTNAPRNRDASTAPDRPDYVVCYGHDCPIHMPLEWRQMAERRGAYFKRALHIRSIRVQTSYNTAITAVG